MAKVPLWAAGRVSSAMMLSPACNGGRRSGRPTVDARCAQVAAVRDQVLGRVGQELLEQALRTVRTGEVGTGVAVEVLGDLLGLTDDRHGLLLELAVAAGVVGDVEAIATLYLADAGFQ